MGISNKLISVLLIKIENVYNFLTNCKGFKNEFIPYINFRIS